MRWKEKKKDSKPQKGRRVSYCNLLLSDTQKSFHCENLKRKLKSQAEEKTNVMQQQNLKGLAKLMAKQWINLTVKQNSEDRRKKPKRKILSKANISHLDPMKTTQVSTGLGCHPKIQTRLKYGRLLSSKNIPEDTKKKPLKEQINLSSEKLA